MKIITKALSVALILMSVQFLFTACGTTSKKPMTNQKQNQTNQSGTNRVTP